MCSQTVKRAVRLTNMIELIKERPRTVAALADRYCVSERTIYRDLADLQAEPLYTPLVVRVAYGQMEDCDMS